MFSVMRGETIRIAGVGLIFCFGLFFVRQSLACSACVQAGEEKEVCEITLMADNMRVESAARERRDYQSDTWWREQYPDADSHTIEQLIEFHSLMIELGGLSDRRRESLSLIRDARATSSPDALHANSSTAVAYRKSVRAVEDALDSHPALEPYDEQLEELAEERREVASEQAEILEDWHRERRERHVLYDEAVQLAMDTYRDDTTALRERAGVDSRDSLPSEYEQEYQAIVAARDEALQYAHDTWERISDAEYTESAREEDGSQAIFDAANERYAEIGEQEDSVNASRRARRESLRASDSDIRELIAQRDAASRKHLETIASREDVQEAQAFVDQYEEYRSDLQREARLLRRDILSLYPHKEPILKELSKIAGLDRMPDRFWRISE